MIHISAFILVIVFLFGIVIGSFTNVLIYRVPKEISVSKGRSMCPSCLHTLHSYDLVPILSYVFLRGKCRYCGCKISIQYPAVEFLTGLLYVAIVWKFGFSLEMLGWLIAMPVLISIAFIDAETKIIPDRFSIALACAAVIMAISKNGPDLLSRGIGLFVVSLPFLLVGLFSGGKAMGGGDMKLMAASGLCLGWELNILALFIGALLGSVVSVVQMIRGKAHRKTQVPFGPYLAIGIAVSALAGEQIIAWYFGLLA